MSLSKSDEARRELARKATQGPWIIGSIPWKVWADGGLITVCDIAHSHHDRNFIAAHDPPTVLNEARKAHPEWLKESAT